MLVKLVRLASAEPALFTEPPAEPLAVAEFEPAPPLAVLVIEDVNSDLVGSAITVAVLPMPLTVTSLDAFLS